MPLARRRNPALVALAAVVTTTAPTPVTADGWTTLFTSPTKALGGFVSQQIEVSRTKVAQLATCVWHGSMDRRADDISDDSAVLALDVSGRLDGEDTVRTYPAYPLAPVLVGIATCDSVALRWQSRDDATWPAHRVMLQRFPDLQHRRLWTTLFETTNNDSSRIDKLVDTRVRPGARYSYRVQALSSAANMSSAFAFETIALGSSACSSRLLFGLVPGVTNWRASNWSCEAVRTLVLLVLCFVSVFVLMRARVRRMQTMRTRQSRLKRIHESTASGLINPAPLQQMPLHPKLPTRSSSSESSSTATSPSSDALDAQQIQSTRSIESLSSAETRESFCERESMALDANACQHCQKRFGIFRRRHVCDICRAVTLCRKCGYQAPVAFARASLSAFDDVAAAAAAAAAVGSDDKRSSVTMSRESVLLLSSDSERKVKIKTICRGCCEDVYRYSTSVRPSLAPR